MCGVLAQSIGSKRGLWRPRLYAISACAACGFVFVEDPDEDYENIYDEKYYRGQGADPLVDYLHEVNDPLTVRRLEWEGIAEVVGGLIPLTSSVRWLDYGCGMGGFVEYLTSTFSLQCDGFEEEISESCERLAKGRRVSVRDLEARAGYYDVVTAIEVLEHVLEPMEILGRISKLLKPGGVFFYTTGNAARFRHNLLSWNYVRPEIHISFYEPRTMEAAMVHVGLEPVPLRPRTGFPKILRYKILKTLGRKRLENWMPAVPWHPVVAAADKRYGVSAFPAGRKPLAR